MSDARCIYEACGHSLAIGHDCATDQLLCEYHADGQTAIEALDEALMVCLKARGHGLSATLDSLDVEIAGVRELYGMDDDE